jgi:hypothetical protein
MQRFNVVMSDLVLILLVGCMIGFALAAWRARRRNGPVLRRFAEFSVALALFFVWFTVVYWDRRWNVWPWADLQAAMAFEWYWPFRLMLLIAFARLWWALRGTPPKPFERMPADEQRHVLATLEQQIVARREIYRRQHEDPLA